MHKRRPVCVKVGQRIRKLRKEAKLSQETLAERCDIHPTYLSGIERGERNPSLVNLTLIAGSLGVAPMELLREIDEHDVQVLMAERQGQDAL